MCCARASSEQDSVGFRARVRARVRVRTVEKGVPEEQHQPRSDLTVMHLVVDIAVTQCLKAPDSYLILSNASRAGGLIWACSPAHT
jgi:hypothetical protein